MRRAAVAVVAFFALLTPAFVATAQTEITPADIAAAEDRRRAVGADLESVTEQYDTAVAELIELENSLTELGIALAEREQELATARVAAREIAVDRYIYAGSASSVLFDSITIHDVRVRTGYLDILSRVGTDTVIRLFNLEESYRAQEQAVVQALADQETTRADLEELAASILAQLEEANAEYAAVVAAYELQEEERRQREEEERLRREEEERRRAATSTTTTTTTTTTTVPVTTTGGPATTTSTTAAPDPTTTTTVPVTTTTEPPPPAEPQAAMVCPVDGAVAFTDTWGDPRSGGRTHEGVDMIAARGTPTVALEAGTVKRLRNGGLGGITVTLTGVSGDEYYYAHLDAWAPGLAVGQSLAVGEVLGYVGNTGNAQYTVPHLHFEHHPGGGAPVNPYPLVAGLCL